MYVRGLHGAERLLIIHLLQQRKEITRGAKHDGHHNINNISNVNIKVVC